MKLENILAFCDGMKCTTSDYQESWEARRYFVDGRIFVMFSDRFITMKCNPLMSLDLRREYQAIIPGYHMNKAKWISIGTDCDLPDELVCNLITGAFFETLEGRPKKTQRRIREELEK